MKANELMIGDLYCVTKDVCFKKGTIVVIRGIDADRTFHELKGCATCIALGDSYNMQGGVWLDYLAQIPLTSEILEKNFESESNIFGLQTYKLNESFNLENRGDRFCLVRKCRAYYSSTFWICDLTYLHQLQHVLRFCGIEKEIHL